MERLITRYTTSIGDILSSGYDGIIFCHMEPATILILQILADLLH